MKLPAFSLLLATGLAGAGTLSAKQLPWQPVTAADFGQTQLASDPDAPAIVLDWNIDVDDRDYPEKRVTTESIRYKIFNPEKSVQLTRLSELVAAFDGNRLNDVAIVARVVQPDGATQEFGKEAIQQRELVQSAAELTWAQHIFGGGGQSVQEKFLAVSGLHAGSILEVQITRSQRAPMGEEFTFQLQKADVPIRHVHFFDRLSEDDNIAPRVFLVNGARVKLQFESKKGRVTADAQNVPSIVSEPFSLPVLDRSVTVCGSYNALQSTYMSAHNSDLSIHTTAADGPWAIYSNKKFFNQEEGAYPTGAGDRQAKKLAEGSPSQTETAARIHRYVQALWVRYRHSPNNQRPFSFQLWASIDRVMRFEEFPTDPIYRDNFLFLEVALDRAAGLEAQGALLPDRGVIHFSDKLVSDMFLPIECVHVKADGHWYFSYSLTPEPVPFGKLPWRLQGEPALLVQKGKQVFANTPEIPAAESIVRNTGLFTLEADGSLHGTAKQTLTGEPALQFRATLERGTAQRATRMAKRRIDALFPNADIVITSITGRENADAPLVINYSVDFADFAVATSKRLIFKPALFHGTLPSPFPASVRHNAVVFPYHWQESDQADLTLPAGYAFESPSAPPSIPGEVLSYKIGISYSRPKHFLRYTREFSSDLEIVAVENYPVLKKWYDSAAKSDQHELVLVKETAKPAAAPAIPAAASGS